MSLRAESLQAGAYITDETNLFLVLRRGTDYVEVEDARSEETTWFKLDDALKKPWRLLNQTALI